jgi:hypothetical protein
MGTLAIPAAAAATAVATAFAAMELKFAETADQMGKAAQKAGTTTETFSSLAYAASQSDVSTEQLSGGLAKLSKTAYAAASGNAEAQAAFKTLGVTVTDTNGKLLPTETILKKVSEAFATHADGAAKAALAQAVFGKSGADLIPMLNEGAAGLTEMQARAQELGLVISDQTAKSAEKLNDNLDNLKQVGFTGVFNSINKDLMPALGNLSSTWVDIAKDLLQTFGPALEWVGGKIATVAKKITSMAAGAIDAFKLVGDAIGVVLATGVDAWENGIGSAKKTFSSGVDGILNDVTKMGSQIDKVWETNADTLEKSANKQKASFANLQTAEKTTYTRSNDLLLKNIIAYQKAAKDKEKADKEEAAAYKKAQEEKAKCLSDSLDYIGTLSTAKNKELAAIGKAANIAQATRSTYVAANEALASAPPPVSYVLMAAVIAAGLVNVASIAGVQLAEGGVVQPQAGGVHALIAEAGQAEAVIPLDRAGILGGPTSVNVYLDGKSILKYVGDSIKSNRLNVYSGAVV